jgi:hypothetical protein
MFRYGPTLYTGYYSGVGYNFRTNFTLLKIAQIGVGYGSESVINEPHLIFDFAIRLHISLFGKLARELALDSGSEGQMFAYFLI